MKEKFLAQAVFTLAGLLLLTAYKTSDQAASEPSTYARFVPERADDFAWENDLIAFRAYGPAARANPENSGIDAWLKRVPYPIVDKWYRQHLKEGLSYHKDHGEGLDNYQTGSTAGVGGTGVWINRQRESLETFVDWSIQKQSREHTVFTLYYEREIDGTVYGEAKTVSIELGKRLFQVNSLFTKNGKPAADLTVCIGLSTQAGKANSYFDREAGWIATWETLDDSELGTGARMEPSAIDSIELVENEKEGHIFLITKTDRSGCITYEAGYGWKKAGAIRSKALWADYLNTPYTSSL